MAKPAVAFGSLSGNGAAQNIQIGFIPKFFEIVNITDGDVIFQWYDGMSAGTAIKIDAAVAAQASNGVTRYAGTRGGDKPGVTIGTAISENGKTLYWRAYRE
jgi:hypothetical protein